MGDLVKRLRAEANFHGEGPDALELRAAAEIERLTARLQAAEAERNRAWAFGYVIACCNIVNLHGEDVVARDVFVEGGIKPEEIEAMDLTEYDAEAMRKIRAALGEDG